MEEGAKRFAGWQLYVVWILRILIGGVFVMSGFVKMVDPWGFLFKIEEYLAVWDIWQPRTVVLMAVWLISGYEFVMGALLALGCYKRISVWGLSVMMLFMLPLTLYIWIENPVSDCGCFGEFWILSNAATFWKNVVIAAALGVLVFLNAKIRSGFFQPAIQWIVGAWISLYILLIGLYGYNVQPLLDFRSFPVGTDLSEAASEDMDEADDAYVFIYEKDGVTKEYSLSELPDSTWTFVDRRSLNGAADNRDTQLAIYDGDDEIAGEVIAPEGYEILLVIPEPARADISYTFALNEMYEYADSIGIPMVALLGGDTNAVERWRDVAMAEYPCYTADDTQLKELSRGSMSVVTLLDGVVVAKNSLGLISPSVIENPESSERFIDEIKGRGENRLLILNLVFGGGLLLIYTCQGIILAIRLGVRKWIAARRDKRRNAEEKDADAVGDK